MKRDANVRRDGVSRRDFVRVGGLSALGLGLSDLLAMRRQSAAADAQARPAGMARNCVLIWLDGGPGHLETFDLKPDAPKEVRGPLDAIPTAVPGIVLSECLSKTAAAMKDVAVIRSMTSPLGEHNFGTHFLLTGYRPTPVLEYPSFSSTAAFLHRGEGVLPSHVAVPDYRVGGAKFSGRGFLPPEVTPFSLGSDPAKGGFSVRDLNVFRGLDLSRLTRRREFVRQLNVFSQSLDSDDGTVPQAVRENSDFEQAWRIVSSPEARQAFDLDKEPPATRNRYGRKTVGQSCLLARRLLERGVPFVTVNYRGWDTHRDLYTRLKEGYSGARTPVGLIPSLDLALTGLMSDLRERGLFEETLIVVMGEFGRTPKLNTHGGRDHWPRVFSVALAGGGVRGGQVIGASDSTGESPADRPVTPSDLVRTIYTLLGLDPDSTLHTADGRPVRLAREESRLIEELTA